MNTKNRVELKCKAEPSARDLQQAEDDCAFGLIIEVAILARAGKGYKLALRELTRALKESPAAMELAEDCLKLTEIK